MGWLARLKEALFVYKQQRVFAGIHCAAVSVMQAATRSRDTVGTRFCPMRPDLALHRWAGEDSNLRLTDYESAALTAELPAPPGG